MIQFLSSRRSHDMRVVAGTEIHNLQKYKPNTMSKPDVGHQANMIS